MAKKIVDEQIKLSIVIDGNQAQSELTKVEKSTRALNAVNKTLLAEKNKLERQGKKESEEYKKLTSTIRQNNHELKVNKEKMAELQNQIGITSLTVSQLRSKATQLKIALNNSVPGSGAYIGYQNELKAVTARMDELRNKAQVTKMTLGTVADGFNKYAALGATVIATTTGVVISLQKMIDYNGKLSDAQADVMKTTGMTKNEVDELTKSFGLLQTRTQRIDLLKIAEEGGRIGIANNDIQEFVRVMDIANVALGDSFSGGVEEVASKLGKLKMLFSETKDLGVEDAYMRIGSAINDLGANGVATERNITEFTTRIGSLPEQLKPTIAETLALGAAFEESGIEAEVSARAYSIFLNRASTETESFAKVMGLPVQKVKEMINASPLEFFLSFADRLKNINPEATEMAQILDMLKINADGANKVIGAAANNTQRFRDTIELSNASMESGTSLINEFGVKNNNLAATLEKIKKTITGWFSSDTLVSWLTSAFEWFAKFIGASEDATGEVAKFKNQLLVFIKVISILTLSWLSYNAAVKLTTLSIKDFALAQKILDALQTKSSVIKSFLASLLLRLRLAYYALTGKTYLAAKAQATLNATQAANPLGLVLSLVVALGVALFAFSKKANEATESQNKLNSAQEIASVYQKELGESINALKSKIDPLISILKDENTSMAVRKKAYETLIGINPAFLNTVDAEFKATNKLNEAYTTLIQKLEEVALAKARQAVREKRAQAFADAEAAEFDAKLRADAEAKSNAERKKRNEQRAKEYLDRQKYSTKEESALVGYKSEQLSDTATNIYKEAIKNSEKARTEFNSFSNYQKKEIDRLTTDLKSLKEGTVEYQNKMTELGSWLGNNSKESTKTSDSDYIPTEDDNKSKGKTVAEKEAEKQKREHEKRLDEIQKYYESALKLARDYEDGNYALMADGYEKEKQILETQHQRTIQDLEAKLISQTEIEKAQNASKNEKLTAEQRKSYELLANTWLKSNEGIYRKVEQETDLHCLKLATTVEKFAQNEIDILNKQYEQKKVAREIAFNDSLAQIGNDQKKRVEEEKKFKDEEYQLELKHLQSLMDLYSKLINNDLGNGIDFDLLTPEAEEKLKADIELLNLAIAKLKAAKSGETDDKPKEASLNMSETDILGFSQDQWTTFFKNIENGTFGVESLKFAVQALQNIWAQYGAMVEAGENRRLQQYENASNKKQQRLQRQLNSGIISQDQYNKAVEAIDNDLARKKAELEYKQAKRKRKMDLAAAFSSMALGLIQAWVNPGFPMAIPLSALIAGMGAMQIATIAKQPLPSPGFESGYYSNNIVRRQQDGKLFNSTFGGKTKSGVVNRPTHFLTGENGPEMIIDSKAFRQMNPNLRESLIREIRSIKGFENGYYNPESMSMNVSNNGSVSNGEFLAVMIQIRNFLEKLDREGVQASISNNDYPSMKNLKEGLQNFDNFRNRNKVK